MRKLSNVEIVLLQIIAEKEGISGYGINQIVKERGYREWIRDDFHLRWI
jgi:hypothetical protein